MEFVGENNASIDEMAEVGGDQRFFPRLDGKDFCVFQDEHRVWIDVSHLEPGEGGSRIYAAIADYARATRGASSSATRPVFRTTPVVAAPTT